jgi:predicted membrane metal-binding protein
MLIVWSMGFWLSFLATLGEISFSTGWYPKMFQSKAVSVYTLGRTLSAYLKITLL